MGSASDKVLPIPFQVFFEGQTSELAAFDNPLTDKNLVLAEERNGETRYRLLETLRQYARDRLLEDCEGELWRDRHLACFGSLAEEAKPLLRGADQQVWLDRLETEHDNLRAALMWSSDGRGDALAGLRLANALYMFWYVHGYFGEAHMWLTGLLAVVSNAPADARAEALGKAGVMAWQQGNYSTARRLQEEGLAIRREMGDRRGIASAVIDLGAVDFDQGDFRAARARFEEGLAIRRELGNAQGIAGALHNLGAVANACGDNLAAWAFLEEGLSIYRELGDPWGTAMALSNLGSLAVERSDIALAQALHEESLTLRRELNERRGIAESLEGLARIMSAWSRPSAAVRIWGAARRLREETGAPLSPQDRATQDVQIATARTEMADAAAFKSSWEEGRAMTLEQVIEFALAKPDD